VVDAPDDVAEEETVDRVAAVDVEPVGLRRKGEGQRGEGEERARRRGRTCSTASAKVLRATTNDDQPRTQRRESQEGEEGDDARSPMAPLVLHRRRVRQALRVQLPPVEVDELVLLDRLEQDGAARRCTGTSAADPDRVRRKGTHPKPPPGICERTTAVAFGRPRRMALLVHVAARCMRQLRAARGRAREGRTGVAAADLRVALSGAVEAPALARDGAVVVEAAPEAARTCRAISRSASTSRTRRRSRERKGRTARRAGAPAVAVGLRLGAQAVDRATLDARARRVAARLVGRKLELVPLAALVLLGARASTFGEGRGRVLRARASALAQPQELDVDDDAPCETGTVGGGLSCSSRAAACPRREAPSRAHLERRRPRRRQPDRGPANGAERQQ